MDEDKPVIDLNRALVSMFCTSSERPSAASLELVVTLRKPDEFEALFRENDALRRENDALRLANDGMAGAVSENMGLRTCLRNACTALRDAGVSSDLYERYLKNH